MEELKFKEVYTEEDWNDDLHPDDWATMPDGEYDRVMYARGLANPFPRHDFRNDSGCCEWYVDDVEVMKLLADMELVHEDDTMASVAFNRPPLSVEEAISAVQDHQKYLNVQEVQES